MVGSSSDVGRFLVQTGRGNDTVSSLGRSNPGLLRTPTVYWTPDPGLRPQSRRFLSSQSRWGVPSLSTEEPQDPGKPVNYLRYLKDGSFYGDM